MLLTTTVFNQRSTRWFGASPRRAAPKGQTFTSRTAPHMKLSYLKLPPAFVAHQEIWIQDQTDDELWELARMAYPQVLPGITRRA